MSVDAMLPEEFADLEKYAATWSLATQAERHGRRVHSAMPELEDFYRTILPRLDAIAEYLNRFPLEELSASAQNLLNLALSFIEVSLAVELFHEPDDSRGLPHGRYRIIESLTD